MFVLALEKIISSIVIVFVSNVFKYPSVIALSFSIILLLFILAKYPRPDNKKKVGSIELDSRSKDSQLDG